VRRAVDGAHAVELLDPEADELAQASHWVITCAVEDDYEAGTYVLALEGADGELVTATVDVRNRASRSARHESFDPSVSVVRCSSAAAREWLEALEHEYEIGEACVLGVYRRRRAS
jgi:hypothetical protein